MKKLFFFFLLTNIVFSQIVKDSVTSDNGSCWLAFPFASYTPETEWAFGAAGLFYFRTSSNTFSNLRASNIITSAQYTTKKQFLIELDYDVYFSEDDHRFYGYVSYNKFPSSFFGIGNFTKKENEEVYTSRYYFIKNAFTKRIIRKGTGGLYIGLRQEFRNDKIVSVEPDGLINTSQITGFNGGTISGLGAIAIFDTRDNTFSSSEGEYVETQLSFFTKAFLSDYNFNNLLVDVRKYHPIYIGDSQTIIAMQFSANIANDDVPFYVLPTFGGSYNMRGVFSGRYRDKNMFFLQTEYRFPVYWIVNMTAFAGIAQVANTIKDYSLNDLIIAYGLGIRLNVIPDEKISLRADIGFSKEGSQIYLGFGEAF